MGYVIDDYGKWETEGNAKILIEPSEDYLQQQTQEHKQQFEQELIQSLKPTEKAVLMAEIQLSVIELLIESGVI